MYKYNFDYTRDDELNFYEEYSERNYMPMWERWTFGIVGLIVIYLSIETIVNSLNLDSYLYPVIGIIIGSIMIYKTLVQYYLVRNKIIKSDMTPVNHSFDIREDYLETTGWGEVVQRVWCDFKKIDDCKTGIIIYFRDSITWLPNRVFSSEPEREAFVQFLRSRKKK